MLDLSGVSRFPHTAAVILTGATETIVLSAYWKELWVYLEHSDPGAFGITSPPISPLPPKTWVRIFAKPQQDDTSNAGNDLQIYVEGTGKLYVADSASSAASLRAILSDLPSWASEATLDGFKDANHTDLGAMQVALVASMTALQNAIGAMQAVVSKQAQQTDGTQRAGILGYDGATWKSVSVNAAGRLQVDVLTQPAMADPLPISAATLPLPAGAATETSVAYEGRKSVHVVWAVNAGVVEIEIPTGFTVGTQVDIVGFFAVLTASPGAATWVAHVSATTGWVIGDVTEHYQSEDAPATPVANPIADSIPNNPGMFVVPASGSLFLRIVPDAGTTTGSADIFLRRVRGL